MRALATMGVDQEHAEQPKDDGAADDGDEGDGRMKPYLASDEARDQVDGLDLSDDHVDDEDDDGKGDVVDRHPGGTLEEGDSGADQAAQTRPEAGEEFHQPSQEGQAACVRHAHQGERDPGDDAHGKGEGDLSAQEGVPNGPQFDAEPAGVFAVIGRDSIQNKTLQLVQILEDPEGQHQHVDDAEDAVGDAARQRERVAGRHEDAAQGVANLLGDGVERYFDGAKGEQRPGGHALQVDDELFERSAQAAG